MDFALESGSAARASHKIDMVCRKYSGVRFGVYEKRRFLWVIPYWHQLDTFYDRLSAEDWLQANWKLPAFYHVTRKTPA